MEHILFFLVLGRWCVIVARLDIEIEGKDGWAINLPTARYKLEDRKLWHRPFGERLWQAPTCGRLLQKFYILFIKLLGGRDFTGYHRTVDAMQLFVAHLMCLSFFHTSPWWVIEMRVAACVCLSWSIEDTLWFILNPFYGVRKYKPEYIPWHKDDWWILAPKGVMLLFVEGCAIYLISVLL